MSLQAEARSTAESASAAIALHIDAAFDAVFSPSAPSVRLGESVLRLRPKHANGVREVRVRWSLHGAADAPLVIVQGGISADRRVAASGGEAGWWDDIVGEGRAIDLRCRRVLSIDWLAQADLGDALAVDSDDQADAIAGVLDVLGVRRAHAYVGASYGAMVGLAFAARHAHRLDRLVAIAGAHRAHPLSIAVRNIQREVVRLAARHGDVAAGLDLARRLAMTTYRGEREFAERCADVPRHVDGRFRFAEEGWLGAAGARFAQRFDADRFLSLSESIDLHAVAPEAVRASTTLVGIASDRVVPLADLCELQRRCGSAAALHVIDSRYGHDAFLKEPAQIGALLHEALEP
ncbi:homoserine O-acetyltransferase [Dokdonella fugitiva]|uniref:Homoserine O-acetyltransferase n=1 Tax=Dokdonella fugitiva TaxID=328517 RepID=A0A839F5D6_9GAMM|nr:homoserine O-succinyltransferase [Dokdonella fugitiva]MBA8889786.1 homoserine O-acetyltransferase [Dokdonella fugitiva]